MSRLANKLEKVRVWQLYPKLHQNEKKAGKNHLSHL